ncbi:hypothetical protein A3A39_02265 [Candidatus Kaiserbacteria bacterium RIFCSPLOWO2_01_FULL_54_13]|uniref:AMP-dependent synthetase/ligase domain-containing protein n=1 Tax=Candidatus Kaiserbacteria bacterium RIFCSPLOWO2_01_FULL_54_13 TaxID=1798512 RepID=A0A1F6F1B3_9BACT|nr:MAG: hypothetical protein A3A39_02265 [Candidatus Kaiserbacteria bacterium RIFCSPLOWO2_01_FULL_54_13]
MKSLETLGNLLEKCTDPQAPPIYRSLYRMRAGEPALRLHDWAQWLSLPLLTKDFLIETPLTKRLFTSGFETDHLRATSGTSGKPPLFCPRTYLRGMDYRALYHNFKNPILAYTVPAMPHWHEHFQQSLGHTPRVVVFDPKRAAASVKLARAAGVDSMSLFTFHIPIVGELMKKERIAERIKFIEICGEACSRSLFEYLRDVFPYAVILPFYGSSEVEDSPIGVPCRPITGEEPFAVYHAKESHYHELIDPESDKRIEPKAGAEGELVITAYPGEPSSFPLIRFCTGDTVRVIEENCPKHGGWSFTILGRTEMDFVKVQGGVLRADEIERVLRLFPTLVSDRFTLHCYERTTPQGPLLAPILHVEPRGTIDLSVLAREISRQLRIAPSFRYADGVALGRYAPLTCEILQSPEKGKNKRIVRHDSAI